EHHEEVSVAHVAGEDLAPFEIHLETLRRADLEVAAEIAKLRQKNHLIGAERLELVLLEIVRRDQGDRLSLPIDEDCGDRAGDGAEQLGEDSVKRHSKPVTPTSRDTSAPPRLPRSWARSKRSCRNTCGPHRCGRLVVLRLRSVALPPSKPDGDRGIACRLCRRP